MRTATATVVFLVLLAAPAAVFAQDDGPGPLSWIAYSKVKPGKTGDAVKLTLEEDAEFLDGLVSAGTILSWGLATPINHRPGQDWNHAQWVTLPNWAAVDRWVAGVMQRMSERSEEDLAEMQAKLDEVYVEGSHHDIVARGLIFKSGSGAGQPRYFMGGSYRARPGQEENVVKLFNEFVTPIADQLIADGVISGYGLYVEELHGDHGWTHRSWFSFPALASIDKIMAAFNQAAGPGIQAWADAVFDPDAHSDVVMMILHLGGQDES